MLLLDKKTATAHNKAKKHQLEGNNHATTTSYCTNRKVAYDVTHFAPKKWLTKSCDLCWKGVEQTPTFGFILKTNEKLFKNWNELMLVGSSETNKFNQKRFG